MTCWRFVSMVCGVIVMAAPAMADEPVAEAKKLFATYAERLNSFDPAVADLYADDAKIENTRTYPDASKKTITVPADKYKAMLRGAVQQAKQRNDTTEFFTVDYKAVGDNVRIETTRFSTAKGEAAPFVLVVGEDNDGTWRIIEEYSVSRPER